MIRLPPRSNLSDTLLPYTTLFRSLVVYGVILSGWSSNSKYPFFSAMRASAQMISYEVSIGFILIGVVLFADSFNLNEIVRVQQGHGLGIVNAFGFNLLLFPLAVLFFISSLDRKSTRLNSSH